MDFRPRFGELLESLVGIDADGTSRLSPYPGPIEHPGETIIGEVQLEGLAKPSEGDRIPQGQQKTTFWQGAMTYAGSKKDVDLFEKIIIRAKKELVGDPLLKRYLPQAEAQLERLRRSKR